MTHSTRVRLVRSVPLAAFLAISALAAPPALAQDDADFEIHRIGANLFAGGSNYRVDETVEGDAFMAGGRVIARGSFGEDVYLAGGDIEIDGAIESDLFAGGATVDVLAGIGDDMFVSGGTVRQHPGSSVAGDAFVAGGTVDLDGSIAGNLHVGARSFTLTGTVSGDVTAEAGSITIAPGARIGGSLTYSATNNADISASAVAGAITEVAPSERGVFDIAVDRGTAGLSTVIALTIMAALLHLIAPGFVTGAVDALSERPLPSFGWGIAAILATPVAIVLLAITLIGIPLAILAGLTLGVLAVIGSVIAAYWVGMRARSFTSASLQDPEFWGRVIWTLVGFIVLTAAEWVPIVGGFAVAVLYMVALGATVTTLWRRFRGPAPVPASV